MPLSQAEIDAMQAQSAAAVAANDHLHTLITALVPDAASLPAPTIANMTATPAALPVAGGAVTVDATVTNAQTMTLDGQTIAALPVSIAVTASHTFTLVATNLTGSAQATASVTVATVIAKPTISHLTATPTALPVGGGTVTINASVSGAQSMTLDGAAISSLPQTRAVMVDHTFTLVATNAGGSTQATASVDVATTSDIGAGYPTTYTTPDDNQYVWSDTSDSAFYAAHGSKAFCDSAATHHAVWQVPNNLYPQIYGHSSPMPGWYAYDGSGDGGCMWRNVGGDWADLNNVAQGSTAFRSVTVTAAPVHNTGKWYSWDIYNLASKWLDRTFRNAGLWLRASNTNAITWASRFNATQDALGAPVKPYLMLTSKSLGAVRVECARNIAINSSLSGSLAGAVTFQTSGSNGAGLLYFDLAPYTAADITGAVLWCYTTDQYSGMTVNVLRCINPADQAGDHGPGIDAQHLGVASNYPKDVGIENDPAVLFVQKFADDTMQPNGIKAYEDLWMGANGVSGWVLTRNRDDNGFTPLADLYNGGKGTATTSGGPSAYWSSWRGHPSYTGPGGKRLKPYVELDEMYLRYYLMFGLDWDPMPGGGKMPGFDGRYRNLNTPSSLVGPYCPTLLGMGRGNSGSGTDGITGWSARGNFGRQPTPGSPIENYRSLGMSDTYFADMTNYFGGFFPARNHYLGLLEKARWYCIELHVKANSVTQPDAIPKRITKWTRAGTVATVVLQDPQDLNDPLYQVGAVWCFGGAGTYPAGTDYWQHEHAITSIVDDHTFTYTISASASAYPANGSGAEGPATGWWAVPSVGNFDGVLEMWTNGRLADRYTGIRFRHSARRPDGGLLGVDAAWFPMFDGGDPASTIGNFSLYLSNIIVATAYIGPLVGYP